MLFVQQIDLIYTKYTRSSNFANTRRSMRFLPVEFDKAKITEEILFDKAVIRQSEDGLNVYERGRKTKLLCENAFFDGKISDHFGNRVFIKRAENGYEILYTDKVQRGWIKSKFTLTDGTSGRIIYNERHGSYFDSPLWYYYVTTFNFVCTDKENFKPKIFFIKEPDTAETDSRLQFAKAPVRVQRKRSEYRRLRQTEGLPGSRIAFIRRKICNLQTCF